MLVVTTSVRRLNLEVTGIILGNGAFWDPQMAAVLHRPIRGRRAIGNQGTTMEELVRRDVELGLP